MKLEQIPEKKRGEETPGSKVKKTGRNLALALMITAASFTAEKALASSNEGENTGEGAKTESKEESLVFKNKILKAIAETSIKYPILIEYKGENRFGHSVIFNYKTDEGIKKYELTIPESTNPESTIEETTKRLVNPDQKFEEINLEKVNLSEAVKQYFEKYNIKLKENTIILDEDIKPRLIDVKSVNFFTDDGKTMTIEIENNDGSKETLRLKGNEIIQ